MMTLARALSAEALKTKRTLTLALTFLAPLAIAFLAFMMEMQTGERNSKPGVNPWISLSQNSLILWGLLMLPLFVTLQTGLLSALEHSNKTLKQLYTLPMPRWAVYAAKQLISMAMIGLSTLVLLGMLWGVGQLLNVFKPQLGYTAAIPWKTILTVFLLTYLASWLMISLHLWVSLHWSSFVVAMGVGIVATVAGVLVIDSKWASFYPWTLPGLVSIGFLTGKAVAAGVLVSIGGGIIAALAGGWEVTRRDVM